jgi:ABC-2 type transport system ATP-binding protein
MSAYQNLALVCKIKEIPTDTIDEKLEMVGLLDRKDDLFKTYSLGMKQRLAIASALLNNPEMLILDEPTNGLDPKGIHEIRQIISDIAKTGTTIILASHLLDEVEKVCDYVIILQQGQKIFEGDVTDLQLQNNWFELRSEDLETLKKLLAQHPAVRQLELSGDMLKVFSNDPHLSGKDLNRYLAEHDFFVESIIKKQPRLEDAFLKITA